MMPPRLPRRERERERHRAEIVAAARKVLEARGLEGVTVESVAREAEFAVGSIYRHFRSKEELIQVVMEGLAAPVFTEIEALPGSGLGFEEQLHRLVTIVHEVAADNAAAFLALRAAPGDYPSPGSEGDHRLRAAWERYAAAIDGVLAVGQREGRLQAGDRLVMVLALMGLLHSFQKWVLCGPVPLGGSVPEIVVGAFLNGCGRRA